MSYYRQFGCNDVHITLVDSILGSALLTQVRCVLSIQFVLGHLKKTQPIRLNDS